MEVARDGPWVLDGMSRGELRGTEPAVAEETQGVELSRCALGAGLFVSKAPSGSVPLPLSRYDLVGRKVMAQQILS